MSEVFGEGSEGLVPTPAETGRRAAEAHPTVKSALNNTSR
jgi:hypothetical protein